MNLKNLLDTSTREVFYNSFLFAILKGLALGLNLLINIYIGNKIGLEDLGVFNLLIQIINFSSIIVLLGIPQLLIKNLSRNFQEGKLEQAFILLRDCAILVIIASLGLTAIIQFFPFFISDTIFKENELRIPLQILSISLTFISVAKIVSYYLTSKGLVWQGYFLEQPLSVFIISLVFLFYYFDWIHFQMNLINISIIYLIAYIISMFLSYFTSIRVFLKMKSKTFTLLNTLKDSTTFYIISLTSIIYSSIDIFLISYFLNANDIAFYSTALKVANLSLFFLQITNLVMMPKISTLYHSNQIESMVSTVKKINMILSIVGVIFFTGFVFFGKYLLSMWGQEFLNSYNCLLILGFGQLINVLTGPVTVILLMCDMARYLNKILIVSCILNFVLNLILIPYYGIVGAAIATTISTIINVLVCSYFVYKRFDFFLF